MGIRVWVALIGVFASFVLLVQGMGYVAFYLSPRDPEAIQRASEFEAVMGSLVRAPEDGVVPVVQADGTRDLEAAMADVEIPNRHPEATGAVHRVMECLADDWAKHRCSRSGCETGFCRRCRNVCPDDPLVIVPPQQHGPYGGTWTRFATGPRDVGIVEARFAYEGLVRWDAMAQEVIPNLAVRWEIADGGRSFTFYLRRGVRWSDGHPFTVDDLIFWYEDVLQNEEITPVVPRRF